MQMSSPAQMSHGMQHDTGHDAMVREMRAPWLWTNATIVALGLWLISSPWTFGYQSAAMTWSDAVSGALLATLAAAAVIPRLDFYGRWGVALVGAWLQFAPLVFWAPTPAAYLNDTIVGALAITLSILVPMMPGMAHHMAMQQPGPEIPPGLDVLPVDLASAGPDHRPRFDRMADFPVPRCLSSRVHPDRVGSVFRRRNRPGVDVGHVTHDAGIGRRPRGACLYVRDAHGLDGRAYPVALDAVDGDLLLHSRGAARFDAYRARHLTARCRRGLVHAVSRRRRRDAVHDPAGGRRGGSNHAVPG